MELCPRVTNLPCRTGVTAQPFHHMSSLFFTHPLIPPFFTPPHPDSSFHRSLLPGDLGELRGTPFLKEVRSQHAQLLSQLRGVLLSTAHKNHARHRCRTTKLHASQSPPAVAQAHRSKGIRRKSLSAPAAPRRHPPSTPLPPPSPEGVRLVLPARCCRRRPPRPPPAHPRSR